MAFIIRMVDTAVGGSEVYCYNTEDNRNSIISKASCKMDVTRLEQRAYIKIVVLRGRNAREYHCIIKYAAY